MLRRASTKTSEKEPENPYLAARREWNERYGSYIARENTWRLIALISLGITALAVGGIAYIGGQSKIKPYIVEVDKLGRSVYAGPAEKTFKADPRIIRAELASFVTEWFTVTVDPAVQNQLLVRLAAHVKTGSQAQQKMMEYFENPKTNPYKRAKKELVSVHVNMVLPLAGDTWEVEWTETVRDRSGKIIRTVHKKGNATIVIDPPESPEKALLNPLGIYVTYVESTPLG